MVAGVRTVGYTVYVYAVTSCSSQVESGNIDEERIAGIIRCARVTHTTRFGQSLALPSIRRAVACSGRTLGFDPGFILISANFIKALAPSEKAPQHNLPAPPPDDRLYARSKSASAQPLLVPLCWPPRLFGV
jgi:hypothetical protein